MMKKVKAILPGDVESNILTRLHVKTLIRFTSVCKSWYSLISGPYFFNMHSQIQKNNISNLLLLDYCGENRIIVTDSCSQEQSQSLSFNDTLNSPYQSVCVVGCCNGVVCVIISSNPGGYFSTEHHISLWNPALRINKIIASYDQPAWSNLCVGFGHHNRTNVYNVITFDNYHFRLVENVKIYSLVSDSWRKIELGTNQLLSERYAVERFGVCVSCCSGEVYCWFALKVDQKGLLRESSIISFHMEDEALKELMLPNYINYHYAVSTLFNNKDSLAVLQTCNSDASTLSTKMCYIWLMKEYDDPKSWTLLCKFNSQRSYLSLVGVIETDQILLQRGDFRYSRAPINKELIVVDIDKRQMNRTSYTKDIIKARWVSSFTESLALLRSKNPHSI